MAIVLVTGATSGFGEACAKKFAANGYDVIITGRRQERLTALQQQLQQEHKVAVLPLCFDVREQKAVSDILGNIPEQWKAVDILINNAGLALGFSSIEDGDLSDWDTMIDTNVKGLLYVSRVVMPWMKQRRTGHIINLGSTAAKQVYAKGHVYCATKAAVDSISQGMRIDLLPYRVKVTAVHPGAAETEFSEVRFKGDKDKADNVYKGFQPLTGQDVADTIYYCATLPPHVCINDLVITCLQQANAYYFDKE
ncbi:SDR family NAD(P)-dependent oxidoreductase [Chitinophaga pinensis]|uniref:Short-chain dehydrogenase/reductase SDR n=1 Tax=Chitinophaga pinensis (strain ATCC 43595 / DSM 2588 / LMG 13176 / NBRC 15968 / NCIMB 11800 / UQM 2034) TaxID=485918 RepID=A0A979GU80_CHIPD|nr:SDR family NAD(P)-dependent oxidoreductase [Chitinophaga pinensis]ACU64342.1 short-chain dehydrogenase/reductase SDR [Chitinophaga pinensis DSM 2588]